LVGLSRYPYASFAALRHTYGELFVQCAPCRRYIRLGIGPIRNRDSRAATFSCCVCGGAGDLVLDDPAGKGFGLDARDNPQRHPAAYTRITGRTYIARPAPLHVIDPPKHTR
jgi:hypothetical protein